MKKYESSRYYIDIHIDNEETLESLNHHEKLLLYGIIFHLIEHTNVIAAETVFTAPASLVEKVVEIANSIPGVKVVDQGPTLWDPTN